MFWILLTIAVAAAGGLVLLKCKVPGGMLVGAIVSVVLLNLITDQAYIYPQARVLAQVLTGAYIGCMVTKEDLERMPKVIAPYFTVMASFLALNFFVGAFICRVTDLDLMTSLFCAAPGGMTDIPLIALDMGADASMVAVMQFVRMVFGMGCLPLVIVFTGRILAPEAMSSPKGQKSHPHGKRKECASGYISLKKFLPTFLVALCTGVIGKRTGIPAGTLTFSLVSMIVIKLCCDTQAMPMWVRRFAQVVSGCCIGVGITREHISQLRQLILPAIVLCLGYILLCVGMGYVIARIFHMDLREAMLCLSPAGASEMALIAADLGIYSTNLVVLQICRLLGVVVIFPHIFAALVRLFG